MPAGFFVSCRNTFCLCSRLWIGGLTDERVLGSLSEQKKRRTAPAGVSRQARPPFYCFFCFVAVIAELSPPTAAFGMLAVLTRFVSKNKRSLQVLKISYSYRLGLVDAHRGCIRQSLTPALSLVLVCVSYSVRCTSTKQEIFTATLCCPYMCVGVRNQHQLVRYTFPL